MSHQAVVALGQDDGPLQAAEDDLPQILQDPLQHRLLTDVSKDAEAGFHTNKIKIIEKLKCTSFRNAQIGSVCLHLNFIKIFHLQSSPVAHERLETRPLMPDHDSTKRNRIHSEN